MILFIGACFLIVCLACITIFSRREDSDLKSNAQVKELSRHVSPNKILTPHERKMYAMLKESIPNNCSIMCQVSFNALIKCSDIRLRNKFNRNFVDFIIINDEFMPIVCIELDDFTHNQASVIEKDEFRDNLLSAALIPTVRFKGLPKNQREIKTRLNKHFSKPKDKKIYRALENTK